MSVCKLCSNKHSSLLINCYPPCKNWIEGTRNDCRRSSWGCYNYTQQCIEDCSIDTCTCHVHDLLGLDVWCSLELHISGCNFILVIVSVTQFWLKYIYTGICAHVSYRYARASHLQSLNYRQWARLYFPRHNVSESFQFTHRVVPRRGVGRGMPLLPQAAL